jgi:hypothetical protein
MSKKTKIRTLTEDLFRKKLTFDNYFSELINMFAPVNARTLSQNKLYWLWITCISEETGNEKNDLHEFFKNSFLSKENLTLKFDSKQFFFEKRISTVDLNKVQFMEYLNKIQIFALTELNIKLPLPEEQIYAEFAEYYQNNY